MMAHIYTSLVAALVILLYNLVMELTKEEASLIYNVLQQCQYGQVKDICQKIEKYLSE